MFIYCFYRHVNHLNGNYVMKISGGESSFGGGRVGEDDRIDFLFAARKRRDPGQGEKQQSLEDSPGWRRRSVLNSQRHVITCKFIAFHSKMGDHACLSSFFASAALSRRLHGGERPKMEIYLREKRHLIPRPERWAEK
jgi:hypothetical protein